MPLPATWTTLAAAFADRVAISPSALAIYDRNERLSYTALAARARQIELRLVEHRVRRGARVGVILDRSIAAIATMIAIWELGAVLVPIDPRWPIERRARIAVDLELAAVVSEDEIESHPKIATSRERPAPGCLALYTSGSTGDPQAVVIGDHALLWRFHALALAMPFASGEVACHRTPPTFIDAYAEVFGPLLHGVPVFVLPHPFVVRDLVAAIEREHVTRLLLVPSILALLLDAVPDLSDVRLVATSGEALPSALVRRFHAAAPGVRLVNIYGSTEVAGDATLGDVTPDLVTIGKPLAGVTATIVDERGQEVANGEVGELVVAGPICANGYWNPGVTTSARFVHDASGAIAVRTGDLARCDRVGELVLVGRVDDQVKIGGCRIELGEIDRALASHPQINAAAAAVTDDESGGARLVAGFVGSADLDELRGYLAARLPAAGVPSVLSRLDALPVTSHGKLDRRQLAALVARPPSPCSPADCADPLVARIVAWFAELVHTPVGATEAFEAVGGDSLARLGLLVRLDREGFQLGHAELPQPLTATSLAATLRGLDPPPAATTVTSDQPFPLTDYQRVMVLESLANRGTAMWTDQVAYTLDGDLDVARLAEAWRDEIAARPALRSRIDTTTLEQCVLPHVSLELDHVDLRDRELESYRQRVRAEEWARLSTSFSLAEAPLFHVCVLSGPGRYDLIFTYHHVILDGESARRVLRAVLERYAGTPQVAARESFEAFVRRPHAIGRSIERWREQFAGYHAPARAPTLVATGMGDAGWRLFHFVIALRARAARRRVARQARKLRPQLEAAHLTPSAYSGGDVTSQPLATVQRRTIHAWARDHHTTVTAMWATLFALHLARERNTDDVVFGVLVSGRDGRSAETVGMLVNCLPLRIRLDRTRSFAAAVADIDRSLRELEQLARTPMLALHEIIGLDPRLFLDDLFISWAYTTQPWTPPEAVAIRSGRSITMTAPHTAMIVSPVELAIGASAFHRTDRIRRDVLALADAALDGEPDLASLLELRSDEGGIAMRAPAL